MTWRPDFTDRALADLVGLETDVRDKIDAHLFDWRVSGPPGRGLRTVGALNLYEEPIAGRYLLGYMIHPEDESFLVLWLRTKPGASL